MHPAEELLNRLERHPQNNPKQILYVENRSAEVRKWIQRLRKFANKKPTTKPALACLKRADELETRLKEILGE